MALSRCSGSSPRRDRHRAPRKQHQEALRPPPHEPISSTSLSQRQLPHPRRLQDRCASRTASRTRSSPSTPAVLCTPASLLSRHRLSSSWTYSPLRADNHASRPLMSVLSATPPHRSRSHSRELKLPAAV
ncbi:uncharacterized protein GGS25DRAFT_520163 [Hypoxylon fragiforme]|uniref:uncharacterized protein n=1 Tax=Hypoxylon fragiforme TaxID=63214 RepID=UPI0020C64D3C|nr:uncharacterized protein GGS25DRAFT_520163 [Hypoxylon fragiforme]KAI2609371.1 hypothetical protein GGS25DRAFT_520163 [Hypoxylon fragiforme]